MTGTKETDNQHYSKPSASYNTVKSADETFFRNESRDNYWKRFRPLAGIEKALVFFDPDIGLETGRPSYQKRMGSLSFDFLVSVDLVIFTSK